MKLKTFTLLLIFTLLFSSRATFAEVEFVQYNISFVGRGESTSVGSVTIENLTQGTSLTMSGSKTLLLTSLNTDVDEQYVTTIKPVIYPNPSTSRSMLNFETIKNDRIAIKIFDIAGETMNLASFDLQAGQHSVVIPTLKSGIYIVNIKGGGISESIRWICLNEGSSGNIYLNESGAKSLNVTKKVSNASSSEDVEEMYFNKGDLLRFTGTSGDMTSIVMNLPTCDHNITFDFYDCTDATGRHYPIVNAGGLLWMAEDLGMVSSKAAIRSSAAAWSDYPSAQSKAAYANFNSNNNDQGAFYNFAGAKAAMPDGWQLPTAGEVDYMLNNLGGYEIAGQLLKSRTSGAWGMTPEGLDTISFGASATGVLTTNGTFTGMDYKVNYWTRSTKSDVPVCWGIENDEIIFSANNTADIGNGYQVRGVRPAPSAYDNIISSLFTSSQAYNSPAKSLKSTQLFESGPLGGSYIVNNNKMQLFSDFSTYFGLNRDKYFYRYDYSNNTFNNALMGETGEGLTPYFKKATGQNNSNGRQNMVVAIWNRNVDMYNTTNGIAGDGTVSLVIYGDSLQHYAMLDSIPLPDEFTMEYLMDFSTAVNKYCQYKTYPSGTLSSTYIVDIARLKYQVFENYSSRFNIISNDFNNDGIGDFAVMVDRKLIVYNGADYTKMYEKTFSTYNNCNVRIAGGDIDGDNIPDIVAVYNTNADGLIRVEAYPNGNLNQIPAIFANFSYPTYNNSAYTNGYVDVKIGDVSGNGNNSIVAMATDDYTNPKVSIFEYDNTTSGNLKEIALVSGTAYNSTGSYNLNNNLTLVHSRGSVYPADIVIGTDILRYQDKEDGTNTGTLVKLTSSFLQNNVIFSDNIVAGNFNNNEDGIEQLAALYMKPQLYNPELTHICQLLDYTTPQIVQLNSNYSLSRITLTSPTEFYCNYQAYGVTTDANNAKTLSGPYSSFSPMSTLFISAVRSQSPTTVLKYKSHQSTLSEPRIYALLAAPPYYKYQSDGTTPYEYNYDMGTSWGMSNMTGTSTENASSHAAKVIFGYEHEFMAPIVATKLGGVEFTTELEFEWTNSYESSSTITKSNTFTAKNNDAVILLANFYDTYTYEVLQSGNSDQIGSEMTISIPTLSRMMMMTVDDYERLTEDNRSVPDLRKAFIHTVGYPFTYPSSKSEIKPQYGTSVLWGGSLDGNEFIGAGSGGNLNREIALDETTASSSSFSFSMDVELVVTAGSVKAGGGYGYNNTNTTTHTEGEGHNVAGIVAGLSQLGEGGLTDFKWNVCWYKKTIGGQTFPVVYYVVQP